MYCVSLPGFTWLSGLKYTGINLQTFQDEEIFLTDEENIIGGGISFVMGDRYVKSDYNKKILCIDANILCSWGMSESLPYDEIKIDKNVNLEDILNTPDESDIGYFVEVNLKYPDELKEKSKFFPFLPLE